MSKVISFEIGTQNIKICVVSFGQKNPKVYKTMVIPTPYDCVEDGYIKDVNTLATAIGKRLKEEKISESRAVFSISSSKIVNREVILPMVKENKIKDIITANAEDYFPIDVKEYNISYIIMERIHTKELRNYRLLVLAVHNNLLMTYYELAERLKLKVESIDYVGNSVFQICQKQVTNDTSLMIQVNEQNTMVNVIHKNVLELQRVIPYGYRSAVNSILEIPYFKINKEEDAFQELLNKELLLSHFAEKDKYQTEAEEVDNQNGAVKEVTESLRYLVNNIIRVAEYYTSKKPDSKIQHMCLIGMGSKLKGIEQLLSNEIGVEVKVIDILHGVSFVHPIDIEHYSQSDFIACAGATIAPMGMIPMKYTIRESRKNNLVSVLTISSLAILTSLLLWFMSNRAVEDANHRIDELKAQISSMESIDVIYTENLVIKEKLAAIQTLEDICRSKNEQLVSLINEMEQKLPSEAVIHSMTAGESGLTMNITVDTKETAAMTLIQLKTIEGLTDVTTSGISETEDEYGGTEVSFSVLASYNLPTQAEEEN